MMRSTGQFRAALAGIGFALAVSGAAFGQTSPPTAALTQQTIRSAQEALGRQGITVRTDGVLSEEMRAAVRKYQGQHHLPVTGELDAATLEKLGVRQNSSANEPNRPGGQPSPAGDTAPRAAATPAAGSAMMMAECPMMRGPTAADAGRQQQTQAQMQAMMQMMQGMMQMMQSMHSMQSTSPAQSGSMQPDSMQPGSMQPGVMQPGSMQPGMMQQRQDAR